MVIIVVMVWNKYPEIVDVTGVGDEVARNIFIYGFKRKNAWIYRH
jgi:hypothetical protein